MGWPAHWPSLTGSHVAGGRRGGSVRSMKRKRLVLIKQTIRSLTGSKTAKAAGGLSLDCTCDFTSCVSLTDCPYCPSLYPC